MSFSDRVEARPAWLVHLVYGLPSAALSFPLIPFAVYLPVYYADDLGLGYLAVGVALFLSRLIDVISDPIAGYLSDHWRLPLGRRKPWIFLGSLLAGVAFIELTTASAGVSPWGLGLWSALLYIGWTFIMVPYLALGADIARSYDENTKLSGLREGAGLVGILIALSLPLFLEGNVLPQLAGLLLPTASVLIIFLLAVVPDRTPEAPPQKTSPFMWWDVFKEPAMRQMTSAWFLTATASAIPAALFPIYVDDVLKGDEETKNLAIFLYFAATAAGMPFWSWFARGRTKHLVMAAGMGIVSCFFAMATLLSAGDAPLFFAICLATGFALAAELVMGPSILADIAALNKAKYGQDRTAAHFAAWGVVSKMAFALAILIAFGLMAVIDAVLDGDSRSVAVALLYAGVPVALKVPSLLRLRTLPFSVADRDLAYVSHRTDNSK